MIAVILATTLICALVAPPFEGPDEAGYRLPRLLGQTADALEGSEQVVAAGMTHVAAVAGIDPAVVVRCGRSLSTNSRFAFGGNTSLLQHSGECRSNGYRWLRASFALVLVGCFCLVFRSTPIMLAAIVFPSAQFYTSQISTDALNAVVCLAAGYFALQRRLAALLAVALAALVNDRSAVALLAFALTMAGCAALPVVRRILISRAGALAGLAIGAAIGMVARLVAGRLTALANFYLTVQYNSHYGTNPLRQAGALFLSSWYLGGSMSFTAFYVEYGAFAMLLGALYLGPRRWFAVSDATLDQLRLIISATILVMAAIVTILQPLTQARYYMFFPPAIVCAIAGVLRVRASVLVLAFAGLDIAYAVSAAAVSAL